MASEAYKRMMKRIPKEIQQKVEFNLDIADEIYYTLESKGLKPVDLARLMKKSESEVSKWMTGTHNFSLKTIQKIGLALETHLLVTNSALAKIIGKVKTLEQQNIALETECEKLRNEKEGLEVFGNLILKQKFVFENRFFKFLPNRKDNAKLKTMHSSDYSVQHSVLNN